MPKVNQSEQYNQISLLWKNFCSLDLLWLASYMNTIKFSHFLTTLIIESMKTIFNLTCDTMIRTTLAVWAPILVVERRFKLSRAKESEFFSFHTLNHSRKIEFVNLEDFPVLRSFNLFFLIILSSRIISLVSLFLGFKLYVFMKKL